MDEDFDLKGFDEAYDISDFGDDQAFKTADMASQRSQAVKGTGFKGNFVDTGVAVVTDMESINSKPSFRWWKSY